MARKPKPKKSIQKDISKGIKRNWKKIALIIAVSLIFLLVILFITGLRIRFALRDSLIVRLEPTEMSFNIPNDKNQSATFNISIQNSIFCKANCSYALYDRSESNELDKGFLTFSGSSYFNKNYSLEPYRKGSGQKIYNFDVECQNLRSFLCSTKAPVRKRSSFITLNYELTKEEEQLKSELKPIISQSLGLINNASKELQVSFYILNKTKELLEYELLYNDYLAFREHGELFIESAEDALSLWSEQRYIELNRTHGISLKTKASFLYDKSRTLLNNILNSVQIQNELVIRYNDIKGYFFNISSSMEQYVYYPYYENNITSEFSETYDSLKSIKRKLEGKKYESLLHFKEDLDNITMLIKEFNISLNQYYNDVISRGKNLSMLEYSKKCAFDFCENITDDICGDLNNASLEYETYFYEIPEDLSILERDYYSVVNGSVKILVSNESIDYYNKYCLNHTNLNLFPTDIKDIGLLWMPTISEIVTEEQIKDELAENLPMCCVYKQCSPCCTEEECKNDATLFPVLFIHGHSLLRGPTPEPLLDVFNKIQYQLQDDGYINAGAIYYDLLDYKKNEWGLSSFPIAVKASYYYDYFYSISNYIYITRSADNLDTYAIRLNDIINILKYKTGKSKVNIIAHSMGGLVARRYIQIFGDESVNKLILVATPNQGVGDSTKRFCQIFGEKKECEDMYWDSVFIKKLNDPNYKPSEVKIYTISGIGCETEGKNGDGVVILENSHLDYAIPYTVNGTCSDSFKKALHKEILNIDKYPLTYDYITNILEIE